MKKKIKNKLAGFSFIEVVVAVFLVSVGMVAIMSLMASTMREAMSSRDQTIAVLLAQEGAELVKNIRENNWAQNLDTFEDGTFPNNSGADYRIDINSGISNNPDKILKINNFGFFDHNGATPTKFSRKIGIQYYDASNNPIVARSSAEKAVILTTVTWNPSGFPANCTTATKCASSETVLTIYGE